MGILKNHFTPNLCEVRKEREKNEVGRAASEAEAARSVAHIVPERHRRGQLQAANNGALI